MNDNKIKRYLKKLGIKTYYSYIYESYNETNNEIGMITCYINNYEIKIQLYNYLICTHLSIKNNQITLNFNNKEENKFKEFLNLYVL